jgi:hypothetical protein
MSIVNEKVDHVKFGAGVIMDVKEDKIWVQFIDQIETKTFLYPEIFEIFLKAENPKVENNALEELRIKKDQKDIENKKNDLIELERRIKERDIAEIQKKAEKLELAKDRAAAKLMKKQSLN